MKRNQLFTGIILLLVGALMLANAMGIKLPNGMLLTELFWPMLLIFGGIWVLIGVFFRGNVDVQNTAIDLQDATAASLKFSHGAGELNIHSGALANELAHGTFTGGLEHKAARNGDRLEVDMRPAKNAVDFSFFGPHVRRDWDVALNANIPIALELSVGANKSIFDLHDMNITDLKLETGASNTHLTLPARGRFKAELELGAASLEVTIPAGVSARIQAALGATDLKINEARFPRNGRYYQSPDYDTALNAVDMTIDAGAASIKIK